MWGQGHETSAGFPKVLKIKSLTNIYKMNCKTELHDGLKEEAVIVCPFCDEKLRGPTTVQDHCCDNSSYNNVPSGTKFLYSPIQNPCHFLVIFSPIISLSNLCHFFFCLKKL